MCGAESKENQSDLGSRALVAIGHALDIFCPPKQIGTFIQRAYGPEVADFICSNAAIYGVIGFDEIEDAD